jgi:DNA (cytosine-5)-methyltransferase 1
MAEIRRGRRNGFKVASTFTGCGGSCLGFRMAGFTHVYASEFVPAARETYAANFPETFVDDRDIRLVQPDDILKRAGLRRGELDVLEGSPPCASFSTAGKRSRDWGKVKKYSDVKQRTDDLFFEFVRLLRGLEPRTFVAENVSGLVKGVAKGYFLEILSELKASGYLVECRVLDSQWLGVPQARQRTIFVGVRSDLGLAPAFPVPVPHRYSIRDALAGIGEAQVLAGDAPSIEKYAIGKEWRGLRPGETSEKFFNLVRPDPDAPIPTVTGLGGSNPGVASVTHPSEPRKFSIAELRRLCGFPDDFVLTGSYAQQWERLGRAVPPPMMRAVAEALRDGVLRKIPA